ncbi:(d)CMP kinase [Pontibacillus yanchengensis]|uniref:(D)CMP kinase n=2 Tax=Pontibacillus yanchengensis TaxID=462910 RepID=A0ACC7VJI2_9BACI|nr:(d)CMP kinase [Pontibacillus yanchengensis]MYL32727.1 (d)CMP kinase [Pontibacillus yanchengensis]MYL55121.1 (d)CMP kinase [Pontibacillus yanchengensis]
MNHNLAIAIDGPAAAGKSTVAKRVAAKLSYIYIDTGAMYRALTLKALRENITLENESSVYNILMNSSILLKQNNHSQSVLLDHRDVTDEIRSQQVTNNVSVVAKHGSVREEMVKRQQDLAAQRGVVMDGRDIGTHVIPDAEVKIFLIASVDERAERRHKENMEKGFDSNLEQLKEEIRKRDQIDSEREVAPLLKAEDAIEIDTTSLTIEEVAEKILGVVLKHKGEEE